MNSDSGHDGSVHSILQVYLPFASLTTYSFACLDSDVDGAVSELSDTLWRDIINNACYHSQKYSSKKLIQKQIKIVLRTFKPSIIL